MLHFHNAPDVFGDASVVSCHDWNLTSDDVIKLDSVRHHLELIA